MEPSRLDATYRDFQEQQRNGRLAELSEKGGTIYFRAVGDTGDWLRDIRKRHPEVAIEQKKSNQQHYYFLSDELRPGSGIIRVSGGRPEGPGGTLTCLLSSRDGRQNYFAAAGHVLSNFWNQKDKPDEDDEGERELVASIYRYRKGFPATNSMWFLGKLRFLSTAPKPINVKPFDERGAVPIDIGIVKILGEIKEPDLKQRTTCYGGFGEWPDKPRHVRKGQLVMKCGSEETHWTYAFVEDPRQKVTVYGPDGLLYELSDQVILTTNPMPPDNLSPDSTAPPRKWSAPPRGADKTPFAVPGDSGTMVVDRESKRPVGMLVAGSVLDGLYVMTPFHRLCKFWTGWDLVLRRA